MKPDIVLIGRSDGESASRWLLFHIGHTWSGRFPALSQPGPALNPHPRAGLVFVFCNPIAITTIRSPANRLCEMTNHLVAIPDYRVGKDYTYDQMVGDIIVSYQYLLRDLGCAPEDIAILADSSGCVSALQAIRELPSFHLPAPGKIILWSPQSDENLTDDKIARAKSMDLSCRTNNLFLIGRPIYNVNMKGGKSRQDIYPLHGDFAHLRSSSVLIQSGGKEIFTEDAYELYSLFSKTCACSLEVYEEMFHNFQTYYSLCDMAKICWEKAAHFITRIA